MQHLAPSVLALAIANVAAAQILPGDIGVTGFSTNSFGIVTPTGVVGYTTPGFQGSSTSQAILHDPFTYLDFIVGGFGFIGRAQITGPGTVNYTLITSSIGTAAQMSWDASGNLIVADAGVDQVRLVTPNGTVVDLSVGPQPWGATLNAGAYEMATGDVIVGANGGLYRLASGTTIATTITTGLGGYVSGVTFDPITGDIVAAVLTANRLIRVDAAGTVTDLIPPNTVASPNAVDIDADGNWILGGTQGRVFRVDYSGAATLIGTNTSPNTNVSGLSVVRGGAFASPFGEPCAATNGPAWLFANGPYSVGSTLTTRSINHVPNAIGLAVLGLDKDFFGALPLPLLLDPLLGTANCYLHVSPDVTVVLFADAAGEMTFSLPLTAPFGGQRFYVQHVALENVPGGLVFSNAVAVQL